MAPVPPYVVVDAVALYGADGFGDSGFLNCDLLVLLVGQVSWASAKYITMIN